jgi:hypothetical protein
MRRVLRVLRLSALVCIASLLVLELGLRLAQRASSNLRALLYVPHLAPDFASVETREELLARSLIGCRPGAVVSGFHLNSRGFLTPEYAEAKAPGSYRIVALGDSFTFKAGEVPYDAQWTTLLGRQLAEGWKREVEVLNLGMPGIGPRFERRLWQLEGAKLAPDLVLLALYVGNDFSDEEGLYHLGMYATGSKRGDALVKHSLVARLARNLLRREQSENSVARSAAKGDTASSARFGVELASYAASYDDERPSFTEDAYVELGKFRMQVLSLERRAGLERSVGAVADELVELQREVRAVGARFVVVIVPDEFQIDPTLAAKALERAELRAEDCDLDAAQRLLTDRLRRDGVDFVDLLPPFRVRATTQRLYRPLDSHWNLAGNRLAANEMYRARANSPR